MASVRRGARAYPDGLALVFAVRAFLGAGFSPAGSFSLRFLSLVMVEGERERETVVVCSFIAWTQGLGPDATPRKQIQLTLRCPRATADIFTGTVKQPRTEQAPKRASHTPPHPVPRESLQARGGCRPSWRQRPGHQRWRHLRCAPVCTVG